MLSGEIALKNNHYYYYYMVFAVDCCCISGFEIALILPLLSTYNDVVLKLTVLIDDCFF